MYSKQQRAKMVEMYTVEKMSAIRIANILGCSDGAVARAVRDAGFEIRSIKGQPKPQSVRKSFTEDEKSLIVKLWEEGMPKYKIAQAVGSSIPPVEGVLKSLGFNPFDSRRATKESHGHWRGGRIKDRNGYIKIIVDESIKEFLPNDYYQRYAAEHRVVMARHLNRPLKPNETIHHIDGNKENNSISNLQLRQGSHGAGQIWKCASCGSTDIESKPLT